MVVFSGMTKDSLSALKDIHEIALKRPYESTEAEGKAFIVNPRVLRKHPKLGGPGSDMFEDRGHDRKKDEG